ncbi:MAG: sel1 repeat family protein, partial [Planctomycetes bacterium]|nr:sel1 repeat family protein [Planctomycetota bacterium]
GLAGYERGDYQTALREWKAVAEEGLGVAEYWVGIMYAQGLGVDRDDAEAVKWYRLAAEQGYAEAQFGLGLMYDGGRGVPQDYAEAVKWYRLAAEQGYAGAQYNLGLMYQNEPGVPQDDRAAHLLHGSAQKRDFVRTLYFNSGLIFPAADSPGSLFQLINRRGYAFRKKESEQDGTDQNNRP